ncbi:acetolactate decarboxylase [Lentisphaerota bacterium ZTH]|nr:acetolactate decarboxylase [Lentisphaerota bacterium]WET06532.1 acetolactate decarboxylase [Lentisphaerota bacterium ZTH]
MKKLLAAGVLCFSLIFICGCSTGDNRRITQVSTYGALYMGAYDGKMTLRELLRHGDTGFGVTENIDGEMIIVAGKAYVGKEDGKVYLPDIKSRIAFANIVDFKPDVGINIPSEMTMQEFENFVDNNLPKDNLFSAIVITGMFKYVKTKSYPPQRKPYKPLKEIIATQPEFDYRYIAGTIVAFKFPPYLKKLQKAGYHFHFLSKDRKSAGHVLDFTVLSGIAKIDFCNELLLIAPPGGTVFNKLNLE